MDPARYFILAMDRLFHLLFHQQSTARSDGFLASQPQLGRQNVFHRLYVFLLLLFLRLGDKSTRESRDNKMCGIG
jgi:hypothetical protein